MAKHVSKANLQKSLTHPKPGVKALGAEQGCVTKCVGTTYQKGHHGSYRANGYDEISGSTGKAKLYQPSAAKAAAFPRSPEKQVGLGSLKRQPADPTGSGWKFTGVNYENANKPFAHNYHHIMPWDSLKNSHLNENELKLLQKAEYNLNEGFNLIILPCRTPVAKLLKMYTHPNNHPTYNEEIAFMLASLKLAITGDEKKHLTEDEAKMVKTTLENWEKAEFDVIVASGKLRSPDHVDTHDPSNIFDALP